ncbi:MAG: prepilin-type N-terminal cleavage/methylation domain-containing protein [Myxococcota bacterium]
MIAQRTAQMEPQASAPHERPSPGQSGFTLIELLVTLAVTVIGLVGLMSLHVSVIKGNRVAARIAEATTVAQETHEELRTMRFEEMILRYPSAQESVSPTGQAMTPIDGRAGMQYNRQLVITDLSDTLYRVRVEVVWADDGGDPTAVTPEAERLQRTIRAELIRTREEAP